MIKDTELTLTKIRRVHQGAVLVNRAFIIHRSKNIIAIQVDLRSKYCGACAVSTEKHQASEFCVEAIESSINLKPGVDRDDDTRVNFPEFKGWETFSACTGGKYTINVVLIKRSI